jgi:hypothetical protein
MERYSYPETLYKAPKIADYSSFAERKRLSSPSLRQFFKIMKKWKVGPKDARLLSGIPSQRFKQLSANPEGRILNRDQLLRVTTIIAIDDLLHKLLPSRQADQWVQTPGRDWRFRGGRTPLSDVVDGGILTLCEFRRQLEARASESSEAKR